MKIRLTRIYEREGTQEDFELLQEAVRDGDEQLLVEYFDATFGNVFDKVEKT